MTEHIKHAEKLAAIQFIEAQLLFENALPLEGTRFSVQN